MAVDRFVAAVEDVAAPFAHEDAFGRSTLVAGVGIDRSRSARRPAHDLDLALCRVVDEAAVADERLRGGVDDGHRDARESARQLRVEVVDRSVQDAVLSVSAIGVTASPLTNATPSRTSIRIGPNALCQT